MPANLPPQYISAEQKLRGTSDPSEKIAILEEMWSILPKHKGTDKIQADIKRRISKLKKEVDKTDKKSKGSSFNIPREGAGQIAVIGPPNSGKSSFLALLTNTAPKIAPYPFSTIVPYPAMMPYLDVRVQLVDLPPIAPGHLDPSFFNCIRNADAAVLLADTAAHDCLDRLDETIAELAQRKLNLGIKPPDDAYTQFKRTLLILNKLDCRSAQEGQALIQEYYENTFTVLPFSCKDATEKDIDRARATLYDLLEIIRIYSKEPGRKADLNNPFTVKRGATVLDFAAHVHKDFATGLKQARVWGSARFDGQAVRKDHVLRDGDIVELRSLSD
jgi:ribosome-interacting GTPase 1